MDVTFVKALPGQHDRVYLHVDAEARRLPVHVVHDLPHLVVESLFGIADGLWGELVDGRHEETARAATARDPHRQKLGRIVSGAVAGSATDVWLSAAHRRAKVLTNAVTNRWGDGPDTPVGVRERVARDGDDEAVRMLASMEDRTIAAAIRAVREVQARWAALPPGEELRLAWPL